MQIRDNSDIGGNNRDGIDGYLTSPNGQLQHYNHKTGRIRSVSSSIPSDPDEPVKRNSDVVQKSYDNIINLGHITFNSDKARKSGSGNYLIVTDLETKKDYGVIRNDDGSYNFYTE